LLVARQRIAPQRVPLPMNHHQRGGGGLKRGPGEARRRKSD